MVYMRSYKPLSAVSAPIKYPLKVYFDEKIGMFLVGYVSRDLKYSTVVIDNSHMVEHSNGFSVWESDMVYIFLNVYSGYNYRCTRKYT